jgi:hypothetical protein
MVGVIDEHETRLDFHGRAKQQDISQDSREIVLLHVKTLIIEIVINYYLLTGSVEIESSHSFSAYAPCCRETLLLISRS